MERVRDVSEVVAQLGLGAAHHAPALKVAYHDACSLQHGQHVTEPPRQLLRAAGFEVVEVPEGHICCGSAGTYNMLRPHLAQQLQIAQSRAHRQRCAAGRGRGQHRLHGTNRRPRRGAGRPHRRAVGLGDGRASTDGVSLVGTSAAPSMPIPSCVLDGQSPAHQNAVGRPCAPSTGIIAPLIQFARSDTRNATTSATSSGVPKRPAGNSRSANWAKCSGCSS